MSAGRTPMWTREFSTADAAGTRALAARLARVLRAGDLLVLSGELGAGKTTFTQGLGQGLGVRPGIISPTFVLVRIHPNLPEGPNPGGPQLVHVDAYRLGSAAELDDIDLESTMDSSVTVVEWGVDRAEHLAPSRLHVALQRRTGTRSPDAEAGLDPDGDHDDEPRVIRLEAFGPRWAGVDVDVK